MQKWLEWRRRALGMIFVAQTPQNGRHLVGLFLARQAPWHSHDVHFIALRASCRQGSPLESMGTAKGNGVSERGTVGNGGERHRQRLEEEAMRTAERACQMAGMWVWWAGVGADLGSLGAKAGLGKCWPRHFVGLCCCCRQFVR